MDILCYPAGVYQANCYIIFDEKVNEGFIIDPGGDASDLISLIEKKELKIKYIILTHGHFDHTGGVNDIKKDLSVPLYMNEKDVELVAGSSKNRKLFPLAEDITVDGFLNNGDKMNFGEYVLEVIETPGHTPGGITIKVEGQLFTGDTLFCGSVGRSDFPGGSHDLLIQSIRSRLLVFPDETKIYPGHGPSSTIGREKKNNPFF